MNFTRGNLYQLMDYPKKTGTYQYFLKNYDFDDSYQTSNIQSIYYNFKNSNTQNKLYPNSFKDMLAIDYNGEKNQNETIVIYNLTGAIVYSKSVQIIVGNQQLKINNLFNISSGMYIVKLIDSNNNQLFSSQILKQ